MSIAEYTASFVAGARNSLDLFGVVGLILAIVSTQMRSRRLMLGCSIGGAICWSGHYAHLGSYTGSVMCGLAAIQGLIAARFIQDDDRPSWVVWVFLAFMVIGWIVAGLTWNGYASALACIGSVFATSARLQTRIAPMRVLFLCMTLCWWMHDIIMQTPLALACETLAVIGFIIAIVRDALTTNRTRPC